MDPFTQRMLEKAEQRSRAHGISNAQSVPYTDIESSVGVGVAALPKPKSQPERRKPAAPQPPQPLQYRSTATSSVNAATNTTSGCKLQVIEKKSPADSTLDSSSSVVGSDAGQKVLRQFSAVDKENMDVDIQINIVTDKNVEVEVEVEEKELTDEETARAAVGSGASSARSRIDEDVVSQPIARIRDASRNRLQRLGALYSNTADLSSPIHRTEGQFHADSGDDALLTDSPRKLKQRYGKLVALANTINQWEDDTRPTNEPPSGGASAVGKIPPPKPDLPSRPKLIAATASTSTEHSAQGTSTTAKTSTETSSTSSSSNASKTKQLKWDPKVINSLEAQGFQRRESSTVKFSYDYGREEKMEEEQVDVVQEQVSKPAVDKSSVGKLASTFGTSANTTASAAVATEKRATPTVKPGLVSGRAAVFESKANSANQQAAQRPQKDPTELSLRERMQLFERNKGEALLPKAAFGMAPPICKIRQDNITTKREETKAASSTSSTANNTNAAAAGKVRDKVAALAAHATTTISENKIKADIARQRQEDMQVLANRFNRQKEVLERDEQQQKEVVDSASIGTGQSKSNTTSAPPPPPPPPPPALLASFKRRSPGNAFADEESKRARKSDATRPATGSNRLYPGLSDLESDGDYDDDDDYEYENCCATATASARSTADEMRVRHGGVYGNATRGYQRTATGGAVAEEEEETEDNESRMESETETETVDGSDRGSLGRAIMQVVQRREEHSDHYRYQNQQQQQQQGQQKRTPSKQPVKELRYAAKNLYYGGDSSINSSDASYEGDDYINMPPSARRGNANDGDDDYSSADEDGNGDTSNASRGSKGTAASHSFSFHKTSRKPAKYDMIAEENVGITPSSTTTTTSALGANHQPVKSEFSLNKDDENMVTLVHTVSFYRRQQNANSANSTPVRRICREQQVVRSVLEGGGIDGGRQQRENMAHMNFVEEHDDMSTASSETSDEGDETQKVQEKIKKLLDEVCRQQQVIAQTSQALNLCAATIEFSGSTESVEGERHLLVATHRRQACLDEVQRLRVEKTLRPIGAPKERGRLTVKDIVIPLRQDYVRKLATDTISGHHLVCLLKYNEHVLATRTMQTLPGMLSVKFPDILQLSNVYADFKITFEIYGMTAHREVLPHEVKYHINWNKKSGIKTPKKKGSENRLVMPPVQSPAGPHVVRTPALVQYGFAIFSLREIQRTNWTLTQVLGFSPLEGVVIMSVNCELSVSVAYKGFLTMFEDISGFGAWHRRWCHLNGTMLNYWKYPDDEKKKTPMGSIDLYTCSSQKVATAPRDICARLNTMLLECERPAKDTDRESLIIVPNGRTTIVRHLMSADTKEEREEWCAYLNKALTLLRAWGPPQ